MGPPSYMWSVVDRNVVMRSIHVHITLPSMNLLTFTEKNEVTYSLIGSTLSINGPYK
jgi:hypothetical protein